MQQSAGKTPFSKKQIPTLLGLGFLIISLVAGVFLFGNGTGVFAPRATPQTTPRNPKVTNVTDTSFTVSFFTDEATAGFVRYGTSETDLRNQASDERDLISSNTGQFQWHHIPVRGLSPNTSYFYVLGTGTRARFDNNGTPFTVRTAATPVGSPPLNKTVYGAVFTEAGIPADGSIIYAARDGMGELSSLAKGSGGQWVVALANAYNTDGSGYADLTEDDNLNFLIQGNDPTKASIFTLPITQAQPAPDVTLGAMPEPQPAEQVLEDSPNDEFVGDQDTPPSQGGELAGLLDGPPGIDIEEDEIARTFDLSQVQPEEMPTISVQDPLIQGVAIPGATVTVEVHSETQIVQTVVADETGQFQLDLARFGQQLEPGEHTVTYSYIDPVSGQTITRTQQFIVPETSQLLAQADTNTPFGSGNPFPVEPTPTPTPTPTPEPTSEATRAAVVATDSGTYTAGSVENTIALVMGGIFFIFAGVWSWWLAHETRRV